MVALRSPGCILMEFKEEGYGGDNQYLYTQDPVSNDEGGRGRGHHARGCLGLPSLPHLSAARRPSCN